MSEDSSVAAAVPLAGLRFLVVEDHDFQRRGIIKLLQKLGAAVVHGARDGSAALEVLRDGARPVDIVLSDMSMPGMDGVQFVRHLSGGWRHLPVILLSSLQPGLLASVAGLTPEVNVLGTISKPLTAAKLVPLLELHRASTAPASLRRPPDFT